MASSDLPSYLAWLDRKCSESGMLAEQHAASARYTMASVQASMSLAFAQAADELRRREAEQKLQEAQ